MAVSKGGQCRRGKKVRTHGCTCSRECLFYTGSFVKLAASAWSGEDVQCDQFSSFGEPIERQIFECVGDNDLRRRVDQKGGHCSHQDGTGSVMSRVWL